MFLSDIPHALVRCWYVVVVGLLATGALVYGATKVTAKEYTVIAEVLLLPPPTSVPAGDNPYLSLGGLDAVGDILARAMGDVDAANSMREAGLTSDVTFARDQNSAAPMMLLTTVAKSPEAATGDSVIFLNQLPITLKAVQAHAKVPENSYVGSTVIVKPDEVTASTKSQTRSILVAGVAGLVLTLLLTAAVDRLLRRRSGGRSPVSTSRQPVARRRRPVSPNLATAATEPEKLSGEEAGPLHGPNGHKVGEERGRVRYPLAR
jgi:hypothetical protein